MSTILLPVILLSWKVGSKLLRVSETVDKLTSAINVSTICPSSLLLVLLTRQFWSFSCVFTEFTALFIILFPISSFLCLNPWNPFHFFLSYSKFLNSTRLYHILSVSVCFCLSLSCTTFFLQVDSNSKEVSYLSWQNTYPNLKTSCHIQLKCFFWPKLLENLLLSKYLVSVAATSNLSEKCCS